ncbi:MAG TPA: GFA family protein [Verrucomicrobiae bacterium]|nr:GFA family protein [Verrucomicrobiae bacterium]
MTRYAQCQCGALKANVDGEPDAVVACSCLECQRRSGSAFGLGAYFQRDGVKVSGDSREYVRIADSGNAFHTFFCPNCGTSLYWFSARDPERVGVAVGAFADPNFPAPNRSVFDESKHAWVCFADDLAGFTRGRDSARTR